MIPSLDDTIVAIATAPGAAGLAVVRMSGPDALAIADACFRGAAKLAQVPGHTLHHGWAVWPGLPGDAPPPERGALPAGHSPPHPAAARSSEGSLRHPWLPLALDAPPEEPPAGAAAAGSGEGSLRHPLALDAPPEEPPARAAVAEPFSRLDEVVAAVFRAPRSYTREHVVELSCHGGELPARRVLAALLAAGARLASPGEFTLRAFVRGRIDLAQAEAVADLIHAETAAAHELALAQLAGELSRRIESLAERVADAVAEVEARVDFAEDVGGVEVPEHVIAAVAAVDRELAGLLAGAAYARAVREGVRVPLVGRPNVGKSSLFNALLGEARAIVTDVPGTTRDRVSEAIELGGVRVTLSDTAGLRDTADAVESIGVARSRETLADCAVALWVVDGASALRAEDRRIAGALAAKRVLVALNKSDLPPRTGAAAVDALLDGEPHRVVAVSATNGEGLDTLRAALAELLGANAASGGLAGALGNPRHAEALARARAALGRAARAAAEHSPGEIVALELREALEALGEVTGRSMGEDLLDRIFSRFCVGK